MNKLNKMNFFYINGDNKLLYRNNDRKIIRFDCYHIVCVMVIGLFLLFSFFMYKYNYLRVWQGLKDIGTSLVFYFSKLFGINTSIVPGVILPISPNPIIPAVPDIPATPVLPSTFDYFKIKMSMYGTSLINLDNFLNYISKVLNIFNIIMKVIILVLPFILALVLILKKYFSKSNNNYDIDTKPLIIYKKISKNVFAPVKRFLIGLYYFLKQHKYYLYLSLMIWLYNFNIITVILEFIAFYLYFVVSFNFANIYIQLVKLFVDLKPFFSISWCIAVPLLYWLFDKVRKKYGYSKLNHFEHKNRGQNNEMEICEMVVGAMGKGKTTLIVDKALSWSVQFKDKALELMLNNSSKFPNFPWITLENTIQKEMYNGNIKNLATIRAFVEYFESEFDKCPSAYNCFGYDYMQYATTYNNKHKIEDLFTVIKNYAQEYFIYIIQCSCLISNFSIREDSRIKSNDNFPLWVNEFFKTDPEDTVNYSKRSKIIDFDLLRLGKKINDNGMRNGIIEFGIIVCSEIGKERGNMLDGKDLKKSDTIANQKNDLFNLDIKMCRHKATVDNYPFIKILFDEQRPESLGADARELCSIVNICDKSNTRRAMPFFFIEELLHDVIYNWFIKFYQKYRYLRGDNTLFMHLVKNIVSKIHKYYVRLNNVFGYHIVSLELEKGTLDGEKIFKEYYISHKKTFANRYATDCYKGYFAIKAIDSNFGIFDMISYSGEVATLDELKTENSFFINDILDVDWRRKLEDSQEENIKKK